MPVESKSNTAPSTARPWLICAFLLALFPLMLRFDVQLLRWRFDFVKVEPHGTLDQLLGGFRSFGEFVTTIVVICITAAYDRRRKSIIIAIVLAQALSAMIYNAGKHTIVRQRPYLAIEEKPLDELTQGQTWRGWQLGNKTFETQSFPSGHSASAFAVAGVLACFYPRLRWMFWILATGCALSRYIDAVHWPSDCVAGAFVGYLSAILARYVAPR